MEKKIDEPLALNLILAGHHLLNSEAQSELSKLLEDWVSKSKSIDKEIYEFAKTKDFETIIENAFTLNMSSSSAQNTSTEIKSETQKVEKAPEPEAQPEVAFASFF